MGAMLTTITTIGAIFTVLGYFFNKELRKKRDREKVWNEFRKAEADYRKALSDGDPQLVAQLDKHMREMRAKHKFLNK